MDMHFTKVTAILLCLKVQIFVYVICHGIKEFLMMYILYTYGQNVFINCRKKLIYAHHAIGQLKTSSTALM